MARLRRKYPPKQLRLPEAAYRGSVNASIPPTNIVQGRTEPTVTVAGRGGYYTPAQDNQALATWSESSPVSLQPLLSRTSISSLLSGSSLGTFSLHQSIRSAEAPASIGGDSGGEGQCSKGLRTMRGLYEEDMRAQQRQQISVGSHLVRRSAARAGPAGLRTESATKITSITNVSATLLLLLSQYLTTTIQRTTDKFTFTTNPPQQSQQGKLVRHSHSNATTATNYFAPSSKPTSPASSIPAQPSNLSRRLSMAWNIASTKSSVLSFHHR
ncbi:hypothetical protein BZA70DRAFT_280106 [Myxozyma melibiosi]|uniref:Uncharacterized protein n=1 Tax=Myxozyma melibiosi TaxID=54550 RepID=A0ABR1F4Q8_9ASCO